MVFNYLSLHRGCIYGKFYCLLNNYKFYSSFFCFDIPMNYYLSTVYVLRMQYVRYNNSFNIRYVCIGTYVHVVIVRVGGGRRCNIHLQD